MGLLIDTLLPPRCAACAVPAPHGLCDACWRAADALRLGQQQWERLDDRVAAVGVFAYDGVVRDAVRGMKIAGRHGAARILGRQIRCHAGVPSDWPVTWVPATRRRIRRRGFDLPHLLAGSGAVGLLRRTLERPDQTSLSAVQRRRSPLGAFTAITVPPSDLVLVDDVRTTGATALAAAMALLDAGARRVVVATLAVGGDDARATS